MAEQITQAPKAETTQAPIKEVKPEIKPEQKPAPIQKLKDEKKPSFEREYIIPVRKAILRVPKYERAGRAIREIKRFIAKHMKVPDRDIDNVRVDPYFNNEVWFRGRANPPSKIRVKATKIGGIVKVDFAETPKYVEFLKAKHLKMLKPTEKKKSVKPEEAKKPEQQEKSSEEKQEEKEKAMATAEFNEKQAKQQAKAQKHTTTGKPPQIRRLALKK